MDGELYGLGIETFKAAGATAFSKTWIDGLRNGIVVWTGRDGTIDVSEYKDHRMTGKQTSFWSDGMIYNSLFDNHKEIAFAEVKEDHGVFTK